MTVVWRKSESLRLPSPLPPPPTTLPPPHNRFSLYAFVRTVRRAFEVLSPAHQHVVVAVRLVVSDARVYIHRRSDVVAAGAGRQPGRCRGRRHNRRGRHHCGHRHRVHRWRRRVYRPGRHSVHCGQHPRYHRPHGHRRQRSAAGWLRFSPPEAAAAHTGSYSTLYTKLVVTFFF